MNNYDYLIKIVVVGDISVGKSSIVNRFCDNIYDDNLACTMGVDFQIKSMTIANKKIKLHIWDTAGQERFRSITTSYYRNAQAILLVFDLTNKNSFEKLKQWLNDIANNITETNYKLILVGNKCDLPFSIDKDEINEFVITNNLTYIECSAKKNISVEDSFVKIISMVLDSGTAKDKKGVYIDLSNEKISYLLLF